MNHLIIFSSEILSRNSENEINIENNFVMIDNVPDEVDGTIVNSVYSEHFTESKIKKNNFHTLKTPKDNNLQYAQFNNDCELISTLNGKMNGDYFNESSSDTSSSESISFRRIVLTPIDENEVKPSNG